jgi:uncharacterized protein
MTAAAAERPWSIRAEGVTVRVRVTPRSSRDEIEGVEATAQGDALKVRVRAVPDKGAANAAVIEALADWLGVPKSTVSLVAGSTSRVKSIAISGDGAALAARAERRLAESG